MQFYNMAPKFLINLETKTDLIVISTSKCKFKLNAFIVWDDVQISLLILSKVK